MGFVGGGAGFVGGFYNASGRGYISPVTPTISDSFVPKSDLEKGLYVIRYRMPLYEKYSNYYDGIHDLRVSIEKMRNTFGRLFLEFADNLCPTVIDSMVERLEVIGFTMETQESDVEVPLPIHANDFQNPAPDSASDNTQPPKPPKPADPNQPVINEYGNSIDKGVVNQQSVMIPKKKKNLADVAWDLWRECRMKQVQNQVHMEALLSGDAYLLIWTNSKVPGKICAHPQKASQFYIFEDAESPNNPHYAIKTWVEGKRRRVTLYYADRIEKYISDDKTQDPYKDEHFVHFEAKDENGNSEAWPLDNPYGRVPAFRFPHKARMGGMGRSELKDVIPIQDALNKAMMDLLVAMERVALPQRWATGIEIQKNSISGEEESSFESGIDKLWHTANGEAKFGQFDAADLNAFIQVHDSLRLEMARISRTPLHYFTVQTGNAPSGAALRTIEKPLTMKCESAQTELGDAWEDVTEFMLLVDGKVKSLGDNQLEANWKPSHSEDEYEDLQTAALKTTVGVSNRQIQRELGYSEQEITRMEIEEASKSNSENVQTQNNLNAQFDRGQNTGANGNGFGK